MNSGITESNINEYGRFDDLKNTVNKNKTKGYFEKLEGTAISLKVVPMKVYNLLQKFIRHITEKWLVKFSERLVNIGITKSLMNLVSSNFLCL